MIAVASGLSVLTKTGRNRPNSEPGAHGLAVLGAVTGVGSSLSGTGGAVILLPLLMIRGTAVASAVAYAHSVQIPVALCATAFYLQAGLVNTGLAAAAALGLVPGTALGASVAGRVPSELLRQMLAALLVAIGLWYFYSLV